MVIDNTKGWNSLFDDFNKDGLKYFVSLKLYESNGTLVKALANWGTVIGFTAGQGFLYIIEGVYGIYFANSDLTNNTVLKYKPLMLRAAGLTDLANGEFVNAPPESVKPTIASNSFFTRRYKKDKVWTVQCGPSVPKIGRPWTLSEA